jgi:pimeloyl-ACP methyl ester carboxylesterase
MNLKPPHMLLALSDGPRALADAACLGLASPLLRKLPPTRQQRSVMVIPGYMANDRSYGPFIRFLRHLGYTATGWRQGRNMGPDSFTENTLREAMEPLMNAGNGKVSLVGHSLGGIYAREIARRNPDAVRQVITLGTPFGKGHKNSSHAVGMYLRLNPQGNFMEDEENLATPPPVPTTAIYSKGDGVVNWRTSQQDGDDHQVHNIRVPGSHSGMSLNAAVWFWVARKLAEI